MHSSPRWSRLVLLVMLVLASSDTYGQRQIALDEQGTVFVLTRAMEQRARLFDVAGFEEARIFMRPDSTYFVEITLADSLGLRRETRTVTYDEVRRLRARWAGAMEGQPAVTREDRPAEPLTAEGRDRMVQTITGLGIGWYGWTLPALIGSDKGPLPFTLYLVTAGVTYIAADGFLATRSYSEGEGAAFMYFATRGILHGYALNVLATGAYDELRTGFPAGTLVSLVEGLTVSRWAARERIPVGRIKTMGTVGDAGLLLGLGTAYATGGSDAPFFDDAGDRPRPYAVGVVAGNVLGILAGTWVAQTGVDAPGDADLMEAAGYLGSAAGFTLADLSGVTSRRSLVVSAMSGLVAGQVLGGVIASGRDLTGVEGRRVGLLTSAGILLGLGVGYALDQEARRSHYWTFATLGGMAGFLVASSTVGRSAPNDGARAELHIHPEGWLRPVDRTEGGMLASVRPFLTLSVRLR